MIGSIAFSLGLILSILAGYLWYPSLVLYYYVLRCFNLYEYSSLVFLSIRTLYTVLCFSPLIFLTWKFLGFRKMKAVNPRLLSNVLHRCIIFFLVVFFVAVSLGAGLAFALLSPVEEDMRILTGDIQSVCGSNVTCAIEDVTKYIDSHLNWSYNNPMSALEIDNMFSPIDYWLLGVLGFTPAHVVLWQGWGSCGEHAIVTAYLLNRLGYTVRIAHFNNIDHTWAEVYVNGSWYIVDPWYIRLVYEKQYHENKCLVPINTLASLANFSGNHKVLCRYPNGAEKDCASEHGY